jgi:hypothetical protein
LAFFCHNRLIRGAIIGASRGPGYFSVGPTLKPENTDKTVIYIIFLG